MKKHLKGLDTLRAIAALMVVFSHLELLKNQIKEKLIFVIKNFIKNGKVRIEGGFQQI